MSTVIKAAQQDPRLFRRLETVSVSDHLAEARLVVEKSREEAQRMLREAQAEAKRIRDEAAERGYASGFRRGYEAGKSAGYDEAFRAAREEFEADQTRALSALRAMVADYEAKKRDLFIAARQDVVRFAMRLAEKVTRQVGAVRSTSAAANLEAALRMIEKPTDLTVHIHPADREAITRFSEKLSAELNGAPHLTIVEDASLAPGGCRLTTPDCAVDASLETQLAVIAELMVPEAEGDA